MTLQFRAWGSVLLALQLWSVQAAAQTNDFGSEGWSVGMAAYGGFLFQNGTGTYETSDVLGPTDPLTPPDPLEIQPPASGESLQTTPSLLASLQLQSPEIGDRLPGRPRVFAHVDVGMNLGQDDDLVRDDDARNELFLNPDLVNTNNLPVGVVLGQGARTTMDVQPLTYSAGVGVAFEIEVLERIIRIKPSAEYFAQQIKAEGIISRAVVEDATGNKPTSIDDFRHILLREDGERTFHGVGVGLEVETDAARVGDFILSTFANAQALNILGGREIRLFARNEKAEDAASAMESGRFGVELDEWAYRVGVGIRLRWSPER